MEIKVFHESFITNLQAVKDRLQNSYTNKKGVLSDIDVFLSRFRIELLPLVELLCITTVPQQFNSQMSKEINELSVNFFKEYTEAGFKNVTSKKEMERIKEYFDIMLVSLLGR